MTALPGRQWQMLGEDATDRLGQVPGVPVPVPPAALGDYEGAAEQEAGQYPLLLGRVARMAGGGEPGGDSDVFRIRFTRDRGDLGIEGTEGLAPAVVKPLGGLGPVGEGEAAG